MDLVESLPVPALAAFPLKRVIRSVDCLLRQPESPHHGKDTSANTPLTQSLRAVCHHAWIYLHLGYHSSAGDGECLPSFFIVVVVAVVVLSCQLLTSPRIWSEH